jgi:hypothetical protein
MVFAMRGHLLVVLSVYVGAGCRSETTGSDPGRITLHRLNRAEYNNTVRDLLGTELRPADDFEPDDPAYGFDNVADALRMSPLLAELYQTAAEQLIDETLATTAVSTNQAFEITGSTDTGNANNGGWLFFTNGSAEINYDAEAAGLYRVSIEAYQTPAGPDNAQLQLVVGGAVQPLIDVAAASGAPQTYSVEVPLAAGNVQVSVAFTNDFYDEATSADRNLWVDNLQIEGPIDAEPIGSTRRDRIITCDALDDAACQREILGGFARRAWRRPVEPAEVEELLGLVQLAIGEGDDAETGIRLALQHVLVSPNFIFRVELDPDPASATPHPLTDHELASRLSYFLWSTMPDDALAAAADAGTLSEPSELIAQVERMLGDPKAAALVDNFADQWLYTRALEQRTAEPDYEKFPEYDDALEAAMLAETRAFFRAFLTEDLPMDQFLTANFTYVNDRLAQFYGLPAPGSADVPVRVSLEGSERRGFLTQGSFLTITSRPKRTSPVLRGKWVLDNLLCTPPSPPPPGVESMLEEDQPTGSIREQLELHRTNAVCASCHNTMDPIGFGLDNFDAIGRYRTEDAGFPIDASGMLLGKQPFNGAAELVDLLATNPQVYRCMVEKLYTYTGRSPYRIESADHIDQLTHSFIDGGYSLKTLLTLIVTDPSFVSRRGEP